MKALWRLGNSRCCRNDGVNTVLWKNKATNRLHTWSSIAIGITSVVRTWVDPNSGAAVAFETNFNLDLNGDGTIGRAYNTVHTAGSVAFQKPLALVSMRSL